MSFWKQVQIISNTVYGRVTAAGTTTFKSGPGVLHAITVNNAVGGTLITVYDSTTGSGATIAAINAPAQADPVTLLYQCKFTTGLTIVSTGTWDATVIYE